MSIIKIDRQKKSNRNVNTFLIVVGGEWIWWVKEWAKTVKEGFFKINHIKTNVDTHKNAKDERLIDKKNKRKQTTDKQQQK